MSRTLLTRLSLTLLAVALGVSGCSSSIHVNPIAPPAQVGVNAVVMELGPQVRGKKEKLIVKYRVLEAMGTALRQSIPEGGNKQLVVAITKFRVSGYGPSFMHAVANIVGPQGRSILTIEAHAQSMAGSRAGKIERLAQNIVAKLVERMPQDY